MSENQNNQGAPSSDDTSALFVSARKRQLAEQEEQRVASEKEAARRAAEEEVRRLEAEVAERKRKAEEDAARIQREEIERRRQAEIEKARIEAELQSAANRQYSPTYNTHAPPYAQVATGSTIVSKANKNILDGLLADKKKLGIVVGAVVGVVILVVLLALLLGGGANTRFTHTYDSNVYVELNEDGTAEGVSPEMIEFSGSWFVQDNAVYIESDTYSAALGIIDENTIYDYNYEGEFVFNG